MRSVPRSGNPSGQEEDELQALIDDLIRRNVAVIATPGIYDAALSAVCPGSAQPAAAAAAERAIAPRSLARARMCCH